MRRSRRARRAQQERLRYQAARGWDEPTEPDDAGPPPSSEPGDSTQAALPEAEVDSQTPAADVEVAEVEAAETRRALAELNERLAQRPDDVSLLVARGALLVDRQQWDEALADLRRAVRLAPDAWRAWEELGSLYWRRGRPAEAADCYRRVSAARPTARGYLQLGRSLLLAGDLGGAKAALERSVAMDPACAETYRLLGGVADRYGRLEEASAYYQQALEHTPE